MREMPIATAVFARAGFTLLELLTVMAIMIIMMGLASPALTSIMKGSQLTQAGQTVTDQLALSQQTAIAKNHAVEVRLYQFSDSETPGEAAANGKYRALQSFEILTSGSAIPLGKCKRLPALIVIDSGSTLSTLISEAGKSTSTALHVPSAASGSELQVSIPSVGMSYNSVAFRFRPDGSTELPSNQKWFLTLHSLNDGDNLTKVPANFVTLQIDPANGHIRTFRP